MGTRQQHQSIMGTKMEQYQSMNTHRIRTLDNPVYKILFKNSFVLLFFFCLLFLFMRKQEGCIFALPGFV